MVVNKQQALHPLSLPGSLSSCCSIMVTFATTRTTIRLHFCKRRVCLCVLAEAGRGQRAERQPALLHRQLPSEVRMSNAAWPLHRMSQHHGEEIQGRCWEVGGEEGSTLQYEPHSDGTAISVPALIKTHFIM